MPASSSQPIAFDARPLTDPVAPGAVRAFVSAMRARRSSSMTGTKVLMIIIFSVIGIVFLAILLPMTSLLLAGLSNGGPPFILLPVVIITFLAIGLGLLIWSTNRSARIARYRLSQFAAANNMTYEDRINDPQLPGMIFNIGRSRHSDRLVRGHSPRFVEFGNYQYTTGLGKHSTTHSWGYVAVKLDVPLPNIVLDALGNNGFGTNLPASFQKEQRLSLEGDFDRYFTLYCPEGYEADALYLFTPDIMARFVDNAAQLDVEIVDDWLFLYTKRAASTLDPATWAWLFGAVGALITKFDQWARWRDERLAAAHSDAPAQSTAPAQAPIAGTHALPFAAPAGMLTPPPGVAHSGRRLKRSGRWIPIVAVVCFGIVWFWMQFAR
ncbi:hypothetical protein ACSS7Z_00045 [Microbacterium sp. A82]|uniref:hypothetical protein n=1 Tax=Microbacterium sp. A82 TaxID=3450452 RepID=UPI003F3628D9